MLTPTRKAAAAFAVAALAGGMAACGGGGDADEGTPAEQVAPGAQEKDGASGTVRRERLPAPRVTIDRERHYTEAGAPVRGPAQFAGPQARVPARAGTPVSGEDDRAGRRPHRRPGRAQSGQQTEHGAAPQTPTKIAAAHAVPADREVVMWAHARDCHIRAAGPRWGCPAFAGAASRRARRRLLRRRWERSRWISAARSCRRPGASRDP